MLASYGLKSGVGVTMGFFFFLLLFLLILSSLGVSIDSESSNFGWCYIRTLKDSIYISSGVLRGSISPWAFYASIRLSTFVLSASLNWRLTTQLKDINVYLQIVLFIQSLTSWRMTWGFPICNFQFSCDRTMLVWPVSVAFLLTSSYFNSSIIYII